MSHRCDDCGQEFETLTRLRLHDCLPNRPPTTPDSEPAEHADETASESVPNSGVNRDELEEKYPEVVGDLPELFDDARDGDPTALSRALAEYERLLNKVARGDTPGGTELHSDLTFAYYEAFADGLDTATQRNGWDVLLEFADAYDPRDQGEFPEIGHVIANALGRSVIRTRQSNGAEAIPAEALAYLGAIPEYVDDFHVASEESYTYGWGIGHPDHSVADRLVELATDEHKFVKISLNTAFYVDQHEAIDVLERLVTDDDIETTTDRLGRTVDLTEFFFRAVADLETDKLVGPHAPPYWEAGDELKRTLDVAPEVEEQIRTLAHQTGVADGLPADWSLADLDQSVMSELFDAVDQS